MTPPAAGWDAEAAARELEREWMLASSLAEQRAIIARHLTLARSTAPSAEAGALAMREAAVEVVMQAADRENDHATSRHWLVVHLKNIAAAITALPPAQPPAVGDADAEVERILAMTDAEVIADAEARGENIAETATHCRAIFERASQSVAVRRAVQAALGAGLCPEDAAVLGSWLKEHGETSGE